MDNSQECSNDNLFCRFGMITLKRSATGNEQTPNKHGSLKVERLIIIIVTAVTTPKFGHQRAKETPAKL